MASKSVRLLNLGLHGTTLGTRFLFIFFLAKYLDPALIGYYGIFTATVGYAIYFVGLDFYTYASREIIKTPPQQRGQLLKGQLALSGLIYLALLPVAVWLLSRVEWPGYLAWWFIPLLGLEHFNQEMSRLLVALSEQLTASLILFVRQGSWALVVIALMGWQESARNLDVVMALWASAGLMAAGLGLWKLRQLKTSGWRLAVDWAWVRRGMVVSAAFMVATLALRGIQTFDRYWIEALGGIELVGAYVLMLGVAGTLLVFLDATVFSFSYPALIQHNARGEHEAARRRVKVVFYQTLVVALGFCVVSYGALPYLLGWINNPLYLGHLDWYPWLCAAMVINALSLVPHYALYARHQDRSIIHSHLVALLVFGVSTWLLSLKYSVLAVVMGLNVAFATILLWKFGAYWALLQHDARAVAVPARG